MTEFMKRLLKTPQGAIGTFLVVLVLAIVVFGPLVAPYDPEKLSPLARYKGPSAAYWLGTDQYGPDIFSRLLIGARATVVMAVLATIAGTLIGALIGTASAFLGGRADELIMRTIDAVMSIPSLLFALLVVNLLGSSTVNALVAVAIAFAPGMARITRSVALSVRKQDYVNAAIARGESSGYIIRREMLPNVIAPIIVDHSCVLCRDVVCDALLPRSRRTAAGCRMGPDGLGSPPLHAYVGWHPDLAERGDRHRRRRLQPSGRRSPRCPQSADLR